ncbi:SAF domain-containing protein [Kineosporia sp. NBRC 101731]|uniref:SAF domain-containing protein n=1 Tax=Kineosporia sp. NBRC 101731 TaxID=3032199 RepID=UPI0024A2E227|nr:SAF domain-containing protein [Kineosporia sp. NBRC 101731]GLY32854.1 hypothetical protein Kisp02_62190 [Kineosporia sp. NBRC 101731]
MGRRTLLLITSVLLAAVGTAMVAVYVRQADERAAGDEATALYLVAARKIPQGTTIAAGDLTTREMRVRDEPTTSVTDLDAATGRAALADILEGTTLDTRVLGRPGAQAEAAIHQGELGVDVLLQDPNRAISLLGIGSRVRIYYLDTAGQARQLVRQARVISIGGALRESGAAGPDGTNSVGSGTVPSSVVGLSVGPKVAQAIIAAVGRQQLLYFAVIPSTDVTPDDGDG